MSFKAKNLEYKPEEPAFLRRLRAQNGGFDDRHERPVPRAKRAKLENDEDDAPAYVVEGSGESLTKEEYEALVVKEKGEERKDRDVTKGESVGAAGTLRSSEPKASGALFGDSEEGRKARAVAEAGLGAKKRKVAKVVGEEDEANTKDLVGNGDEQTSAVVKKKLKKKGKPIKLSFGDDEES